MGVYVDLKIECAFPGHPGGGKFRIAWLEDYYTDYRVAPDGGMWKTTWEWREPDLTNPRSLGIKVPHRTGEEPWDYTGFLTFGADDDDNGAITLRCVGGRMVGINPGDVETWADDAQVAWDALARIEQMLADGADTREIAAFIRETREEGPQPPAPVEQTHALQP